MRFEDAYPQALPGFRTAEGHRRGRRTMNCIVCQAETAWFHEVVCLYFCSPECFEQHQGVRAPAEGDGEASEPS